MLFRSCLLLLLFLAQVSWRCLISFLFCCILFLFVCFFIVLFLLLCFCRVKCSVLSLNELMNPLFHMMKVFIQCPLELFILEYQTFVNLQRIILDHILSLLNLFDLFFLLIPLFLHLFIIIYIMLLVMSYFSIIYL